MQIEQVHFNERDVEIPSLLHAVENRLEKVTSLLDVGARYSYPFYAPQLRELLSDRLYSALDLGSDPDIENIVDEYITSDLLDSELSIGKFSYITCVSVIEHVGLKPFVVQDFRDMQRSFLSKMLGAAEVGVFLTFPFGREHVVSGEYSNITAMELNYWGEMAHLAGYDGSIKFWFNPAPQEREYWNEISFSEAANVEALQTKGCRCVGIVEFFRRAEKEKQ